MPPDRRGHTLGQPVALRRPLHRRRLPPTGHPRSGRRRSPVSPDSSTLLRPGRLSMTPGIGSSKATTTSGRTWPSSTAATRSPARLARARGVCIRAARRSAAQAQGRRGASGRWSPSRSWALGRNGHPTSPARSLGAAATSTTTPAWPTSGRTWSSGAGSSPAIGHPCGLDILGQPGLNLEWKENRMAGCWGACTPGVRMVVTARLRGGGAS